MWWIRSIETFDATVRGLALLPIAFAAQTDFDRLPWWVRAIALVGVPSAIACALTYFLMFGVSGDLRSVRANSEMSLKNHTMIMENQTEILRRLEVLQNGDVLVARYLQALCLNGARSDVERDRCLVR